MVVYLWQMPRASEAEKAERLNRARYLFREVDQFSDAVARLAQDCSISPRQAYRYLEQARYLKAPVAPHEKTGIYSQAPAQSDSTGPGVRHGQKIVHQRGGQPSIARAAAARTRAWVSRGQHHGARVGWNINLIVCCRTNWRRLTSCSCQRNVSQSESKQQI